MPHEPIDLDARTFLIALAIVFGFQFAEFAADVATLRPMPIRKAEIYISKQGLGQAAVLYFGVFIGVLVAFVLGNSWFAVPLLLFKLLIDIGQPIQFFLGGGETYDDPNANLLRAVEFKSRIR